MEPQRVTPATAFRAIGNCLELAQKNNWPTPGETLDFFELAIMIDNEQLVGHLTKSEDNHGSVEFEVDGRLGEIGFNILLNNRSVLDFQFQEGSDEIDLSKTDREALKLVSLIAKAVRDRFNN